MTARKLEALPYYRFDGDIIRDSRLDEPLGQIAAAQSFRERMDEALERACADVAPPDRYKVAYANKMNLIDAAGSDGEIASGAVEMFQATPKDGSPVTVISSGQWSHYSGLPVADRSWSAEFDDPKLAKAFWKKHWRPNFDGDNFIESCQAFIAKKPDIPRDSIRFQWSGMLTAWPYRKVDEFPMLKHFATEPEQLVKIPSRRSVAVAPEYTVGQLYKIPFTYWGLTTIKEWAVKTCLAAVTVEPESLNYFAEKHSTTAIQWDDGTMSYYNYPDIPRPEPLQVEDIRFGKRLAESQAQAAS